MRTIFALIVASLLTGCAGIGFKTEMYRIDERSENQRTYRRPTALKCWFTDCSERIVDESAGS